MILFYSDRYYELIEGDGGLFCYTTENSDHFVMEQVDIPEEEYSVDNAGWPVVIIIDNKPHLFGLNGIIPYDEQNNRFMIDKKDPSFKLDLGGLVSWRETLSYDPKEKRYLKFLMYCLRNETIFYDKPRLKYRVKIGKQRFPFDYDTLKQDPISSQLYSLIDDNLYLWSDEKKWSLEHETTIEKYRSWSSQLQYNDTVKEVIAAQPHLVVPTRPSIWTMNKKTQGGLGFDLRYLDKFGSGLSIRDTNPIMVSDDLKTWQQISYVSNTHQEVFDSGFTTDLLHTIPITDTYPAVIYDDYHDRYFFYNRANISIGCRYISVSESSNLMDWSPNQMIQMEPEFSYRKDDNYYVPSMMKYRGTPYLFAVMTHFNLKTNQLEYHYCVSMDGHRYEHVSTFHSHLVTYAPEKTNFHWNLNMMTFIPDSLYCNEETKKQIMFYTCHSHTPGFRGLYRLSVSQDRFTSLKSTRKAVFVTSSLKNSQEQWSLNGSTEKDGFIKLQILEDKNDTVLWESSQISGNHHEYPLQIPATIPLTFRLRITLVKADIFSVRGPEYHQPLTTETPTHLRFAYLEHTNVINGKYRDGVNHNGWREIEIPSIPSEVPVSLIGQPYHQEMSTYITQKVRYSSGSEIEVVLVDNRYIDEKDNYPDTLDYVYQKSGTSAQVVEVKMIKKD